MAICQVVCQVRDQNLKSQLAEAKATEAKATARKWYIDRGLPIPEEVGKTAVEPGFRRFVHQKQRSSRNQRNYRLAHPGQKQREKARRKTEAQKSASRGSKAVRA